MKDRVPESGKAGHVLLTPASGGNSVEYVLAMADNPTSGNEGTPLNKANLLDDTTASIIQTRINSLRTAIQGVTRNDANFPADPSVNDALKIMGYTNLRYKVGTYVGNIQPIQGYTTYSNGSWDWDSANAWNTQTTHKFTLDFGFRPLAVSIFDAQTGKDIDSQDGFTYPTTIQLKTVDNEPAMGYSAMAADKDARSIQNGNFGGYVWIHGSPVGLVGTINTSTGYTLRGVPLDWSSGTGVTWSGAVFKVNNERWDDSLGRNINPTKKWFLVRIPFTYPGRTYYYVAIGI